MSLYVIAVIKFWHLSKAKKIIETNFLLLYNIVSFRIEVT